MAVGTAELVPALGMGAGNLLEGAATGNYGQAGEGAFDTGMTLGEIFALRGAGRAATLSRAEATVGAAETKLAGGTFDLGISGPQYTMRAPTIAGFEGTTGTVNTRAFVVHGNSKLSPRPATLYELYQIGDDGARTFLKYGISQNPSKRYSQTFMADKRIFPVATGSRADMLTLERQMVTQNPGPLNFEPWAVKARGGQ